jgi:rhodanese-related sulfurtransferase
MLLLVPLVAGGCRSLGNGAGEDLEKVVAFSRVRPPVAFEMLRDNPGMPIVDLRSRYEYTGPIGHIRRARNVPLEEIPENLAGLSPLKGRTFLVYCGHDECGAEGLRALVAAGFKEVILMDGGIDAWVLDGFGTVTGPPPPMHFPEEDSDKAVVD